MSNTIQSEGNLISSIAGYIHQVLGHDDISLLSNQIKSDQLIGHFLTSVNLLAPTGALIVLFMCYYTGPQALFEISIISANIHSFSF